MKHFFTLLSIFLFTQNFYAQCPTIKVEELTGVPGFSQLEDLVKCGKPDTLAYLIFIEEPGSILGNTMTVTFKNGMQYEGFQGTA